MYVCMFVCIYLRQSHCFLFPNTLFKPLPNQNPIISHFTHNFQIKATIIPQLDNESNPLVCAPCPPSLQGSFSIQESELFLKNAITMFYSSA